MALCSLWSRNVSIKLSSPLELVKTMSGLTCSRTNALNIAREENLVRELTHFCEVIMGRLVGIVEIKHRALYRVVICCTDTVAGAQRNMFRRVYAILRHCNTTHFWHQAVKQIFSGTLDWSSDPVKPVELSGLADSALDSSSSGSSSSPHLTRFLFPGVES